MAQAGENTLGRLNEVLFAELERLDALDGRPWAQDAKRARRDSGARDGETD